MCPLSGLRCVVVWGTTRAPRRARRTITLGPETTAPGSGDRIDSEAVERGRAAGSEGGAAVWACELHAAQARAATKKTPRAFRVRCILMCRTACAAPQDRTLRLRGPRARRRDRSEEH